MLNPALPPPDRSRIPRPAGSATTSSEPSRPRARRQTSRSLHSRKRNRSDSSGRKKAKRGKSKPDKSELEQALQTSFRSRRSVMSGWWRAGKQAQHFRHQRRKRYFRDRLSGVEDDIPAGGDHHAVQPKGFAQASLHAVPQHGASQTRRGRNSQTGQGKAIRPIKHRAQAPAAALAFVINPPKLPPAQKPCLLGECLRRQTFHGVKRWRPFCRRRFTTPRPPAVRMRTRNPCVLARRRRLG
jgi:hypothetical protein